jgi:hypothetical protein
MEKENERWHRPNGSGVDLEERSSEENRPLLRKEVIQPHLPIRLPCYDLVPLTKHSLDTFLPEGLEQRLREHSIRLT